ncbi:FMN-linked oxidoreductase [Lepidopterella palustris CBS 459.81]|uniref:tRNA-dihydrouridine(16/17) synthase [NAD(P)(+)] n=1 Tax=Lepidopterella palustris CBS 459.81 TaxID=1314670 RepID=A0A8E2E957_9PEZI|nr:FMN-linked oxidoreductase [Lepidopterella palustris CBS 459.81]
MENGHEKPTLKSVPRTKVHGRAFYESIGSPKLVLAPMVEQSEFAWRMLTRSFLPPSSSKNLLAYTPMFHSRMFTDTPKYRESHFQPLKTAIPSPPDPYHLSQFSQEDKYLDGNPAFDRPLFVQFCSNSPEEFLAAAQHVAPFCDAVDLNLGCPQGIARKGHYGAYLQEDWDLISRMINRLHKELDIPVTAKMRILETKEKTLQYAKTILDAGASIITVHGRRREQKGHNTGLADWTVLKYLRENLPPDTVIFANGNILQHGDIKKCLEETGADAVMIAEGNLNDPTIFAGPVPEGQEGREYWRGHDGNGGYRVDAVMRRYLDIIYIHVLGKSPPTRAPLFLPTDLTPEINPNLVENGSLHTKPSDDQSAEPPAKRQKTSKADKKQQKSRNANISAMQPHLFHLLRPLVSKFHNVRDALARSRTGDIETFEEVLQLVEQTVKEGLIEYENSPAESIEDAAAVKISANGNAGEHADRAVESDPYTSSLATVARCRRPWWVCQPYVRPLPKEALEKGSMTLSKKEKARLAKDEVVKAVGLHPEGRAERVEVGTDGGDVEREHVDVPREGVMCG